MFPYNLQIWLNKDEVLAILSDVVKTRCHIVPENEVSEGNNKMLQALDPYSQNPSNVCSLPSKIIGKKTKDIMANFFKEKL